MYPGHHASQHPDRAAIIMAGSGEAVSYAAFEARSNQLAHFLRQQGLQPRDHYAIFMENHIVYLEACAAGERTGLYYTCVNSYLQADELAYILNNSESALLITSAEKLSVAQQAMTQAPGVKCLLVAGAGSDSDQWLDYEAALAQYPVTPIEDEQLGTSMLYSSGTTGRPKGILRPLPDAQPDDPLPLYRFLDDLWRYRDDMVYLSPAPLYHSAPQAATGLTLRRGGTVVVMERFDPLSYLQLIERYQVTHSQLVPTMFSRMLKLSEADRQSHDLSSLEIAIHAAAPCPVAVKQQMIDWWGPIIHEYYGATEGLGFAACDAQEWLAHKGTVGKIILGEVHILDEAGQPLPPEVPGEIWFETATEFSYFNNEDKTREAMSADGRMSTVGDVGYLRDGYLFLTDRSTFMIISGGVNIYPQETEDLLITHPLVMDAAVFGVPNEDLGEEVKAVIQLVDGVPANTETTQKLLAFCAEHLARHKCPRSIDYEAELPRLPTGKLYKRVLKDRYWSAHQSGIV